jgi:hypothetical protein
LRLTSQKRLATHEGAEWDDLDFDAHQMCCACDLLAIVELKVHRELQSSHPACSAINATSRRLRHLCERLAVNDKPRLPLAEQRRDDPHPHVTSKQGLLADGLEKVYATIGLELVALFGPPCGLT